MKVVHTYATSPGNTLSCDQVLMQRLSAEQAKKYYGNITLVGSLSIINQCKELEFPYDEYIEIPYLEGSPFSIPKLQAFLEFEEEVLHIDTDTILFKKLHFNDSSSPVIFNSLDLNGNFDTHPNKYNSTVNDIFHTLSYSNIGDAYSNVDYRSGYLIQGLVTYGKPFIQLGEYLPKGCQNYFDFSTIPNMNTVYVKDSKVFHEAVHLALSHYYSFAEEIDKIEYGACYIEQLAIHLILQTISSKYRNAVQNNKHVLYAKDPFYIQPSEWTNDIYKKGLPATVEYLVNCKCCDQTDSREFVLDESTNLMEFLDSEFGKFVHFGPNKGFDIIQAWTAHFLVKVLGQEKVAQLILDSNSVIPEGIRLYESASKLKLTRDASAI